MPDLNDVAANLNLQKFCDYMNNTWIKDKCLFPRSSWNLFDEYSSRTNNISESYNHQINGQVDSANFNVYKVLARDVCFDRSSVELCRISARGPRNFAEFLHNSPEFPRNFRGISTEFPWKLCGNSAN